MEHLIPDRVPAGSFEYIFKPSRIDHGLIGHLTGHLISHMTE